MAAVLSSLHSPPRPLKERPLCSVKPAGSQQGPGRAPPTGRNQAPAVHSPDLTPFRHYAAAETSAQRGEGRAQGHTARWRPHFSALFYPRFTDKKTEAPKPRLCPGAASTSWGPAAPPARPGQACAKKPRRLETEKPGGLSARCPGDARGAASLSQCQDLAGPSTAASSQTRLRSLNRAIVVPAPRTPSWTRLVRNHGSCRHGPKTWVSALPARRGAPRASPSVLAP